MRTQTGKVFTAVHLEAYVGSVAVCAEAVAIGMGAAAGDTVIQKIVVANRAGDKVAPCGICRELISDDDPSAEVIVPGSVGPQKVGVMSLIPNKTTRSGS